MYTEGLLAPWPLSISPDAPLKKKQAGCKIKWPFALLLISLRVAEGHSAPQAVDDFSKSIAAIKSSIACSFYLSLVN